MEENKKQLIKRLCESWINSAYQTDGSIGIGVNTEKCRLLTNNIVFHELTYEETQAACVGLTHVLLLKGMNTIIDRDHLVFWSWMGELFSSRETGYFGTEEFQIQKLFEVVIRASLAGIQPPVRNQEEWEVQNQIRELTEFNTLQLVTNSSLVQAYLVFPLLEAVIKKACREYIDYSGKVITDFTVSKKDGTIQNYGCSGQGKRFCSSLRDLLFLLYYNVADVDLKEQITLVRQHIFELDNQEDPFDLIYRWRNSSLHGETSYPTIGGTLLNLVILIALAEIKQNYELIKSKTWSRVQWELQSFNYTKHRSPWSFYPPFWS